MRILLSLLALALAGCQTSEPVPAAPVATPPPLAPAIPVRPPDRTETERRQAQLIEALINQNDALAQRLVSGRTAVSPPAERRVARTVAPVDARPFLVPNAEGFVDLRAPAGKADEPVNPFEVPATSEAKGREVALRVSGIIAGAETCAVINDRTVSAGDVVESLVVESIARDGVFLVAGERRMRLPVSETPVRVRLPD